MKHNLSKEIIDTDIAVIGMSCRFPGAKNVDEFWRNLENGKESVSFFTDVELENGDEEARKDPHFVKAGFILDDVKSFDANFFGFSEQDARVLDPQHRKFLECSWETLEDSGYNPDLFKGSIGVFAGSGMSTYFLNNIHPNIGYHPNRTFLESMGDLQLLTANDRDYLTTRVSYKLNLRGPSINVQTACSTALVATHLACQSILNGESDMAIAGAVTILCPQKTGYLYQQDMILSPDGHCRPFDARAKGTVFGSGVGVVLLKKLSDAVRDGDAIHAVIKGTAVNNDGAVKVGYSAPSVNGQVSVIAEAMAVANVESDDITFIEGHGTATQIGDLVEVAALKQAFQTERRDFCALGSVKSNIGHLGWASGMAGLIKVILAIKHKRIPATINFEKGNPQIDFVRSPFYVNTDSIDWETDGLRYAGVSAFGLGGTNAHIVLSEAPEANRSNPQKNGDNLFTLSAKSEVALRMLAERHVKFLEKGTDASLFDICYTANIGRKHFDKRLAFGVSSLSELQGKLNEFIDCDSIQEYDQLRSRSDKEVLACLIEQYESGKCVDFDEIYGDQGGRRVHLPTYPFQQKEYWVGSTRESITTQEGEPTHSMNHFYQVQREDQSLYGNASENLPSISGLSQAVSFAKNDSVGFQPSPKNWLIFTDSNGMGDFLIKQLTELGDSCTVVQKGEFFKEEIANCKYRVNLFKSEDFDALFDHIQKPIHKVLYLWSLEKDAATSPNIEFIKKLYLQDCGGLLNAVKSIVSKLPTPPALFVITQGAQTTNANSDINELIQSSVWGMSRVVAIEHPELRCKIIDIQSFKQGTDLVNELLSNNTENQVILGDRSRCVLRLVRTNVDLVETNTNQLLFKEDAVYVITGGLGGLGLKVAEWMADTGARHIVLVGRQEPSDETRNKIDVLIKKGVDIRVSICDVSEYGSLKELFSNLKKIGTVKGIVHAAGVIDDGIILQQNFERLLKPASAKVLGSWNLHTLSKEGGVDLDFFVLFSSVVSTIGNVGQSNHAAANSFMNNLALYRQCRGLPATVIQWGAWADIGILARYPEVVGKLDAIGIGLIEPNEGIIALEFILRRRITTAIFAPLNWDRFLKTNKLENDPFFTSLGVSPQQQSEVLIEDDLVAELVSLTDIDQFAFILRNVAEHVRRILGLQQIDGFEDEDFFDYGMDSLTSIQLRNNLQSDFKCSLHPTIAYKYPTVRKLSEYMVNIIKFRVRDDGVSVNKKKYTPVSASREISMQQRRWIQLAEKDYGRLLIPILFHTGLNEKALRVALEQVVNRHEVLKYKFSGEEAFVVDIKDLHLDDPELFIDASDRKDQALVIKQEADKLRSCPPNPQDRPTWVIRCIKLSESKFLLLLHIQHLEFDGTSVSIFVDDLRRFYSDFVSGTDSTYLPAVQYSEYVEWQKRYLNTDISKDREFFKQLFADVFSTTILPNHSGHNSTESHPSACYTPAQIKGVWEQLQSVGKKLKVSPFSILCSTYAQLVGEIVNSDQVVLGTIVSSRPSSEFDKTIGPFVQPFPMKISLKASLQDMVSMLHHLVTEINERSSYPVSDMVNHIPIFKDMGIDTYFTDSFIMLNNYPRQTNIQPNVEVLESLGPILKDGLSDLTSKSLNEVAGLFLIIDCFEGEMRFNFWYHLHRFSERQIQEWSTRYSDLLKRNIQLLDA